MKKIVTILSAISILLGSSPAFAASGKAGFAKPAPQGLDNLLLIYTGYSVNGDGTSEEQHWETQDFLPILTHINRKTNRADGEMFTDYLFTANAVQNRLGQMKFISQAGDVDKSKYADPSDWWSYMNELFRGNQSIGHVQNINALYEASLQNRLDRAIHTNVWIALPYPDPKNFRTDQQRIATLENWIDTFIVTWDSYGYASNFKLKGFYWIGESVDRLSSQNDEKVIKAINDYIHNKVVTREFYSNVWIPFEGANDWDQWKKLGFDVSILQPNYYFSTNKGLQKGAQDAYTTNQGMEMEMDLGVTWDFKEGGYRSRFISYLNDAATGDTLAPASPLGKPLYQPFMTPSSALAWYTGGWWWADNKRDQSLEKLYRTGDPLYDAIYDFIQGKYKPLDYKPVTAVTKPANQTDANKPVHTDSNK